MTDARPEGFIELLAHYQHSLKTEAKSPANETLIRYVEELQATLRRRNETITEQRATINSQRAELTTRAEAEPDVCEADSSAQELLDQVAVSGEDTAWVINLGARLNAHGVESWELDRALQDLNDYRGNKCSGGTWPNLRSLQKQIGHDNAKNGWHERAERLITDGDKEGLVDHILAKLMLVNTELSEAVEEARNGRDWGEVYYKPESPTKPEGFMIELADAFIRILDTADILDLNLAGAIKTKLASNHLRGYKHGGKVV